MHTNDIATKMDICIDKETDIEYSVSEHGMYPMYKSIYIAYGNNLNQNTINSRCPNAKLLGKTFLNGYELVFTGNPIGAYLSIHENKNAAVPVAVYELTKNDEDSLDYWENAPDTYYKKVIPITIDKCYQLDDADFVDSQTFNNSFSYIMKERRYGVPSKSYVQRVLNGYERFGFDKKYLLDALKKSGVSDIESLP